MDITDEGLAAASENLVEVALLALLGLVVVLVLVVILVWSIYKSAQFQPQAMLVIVLGVLALVSAIGYFVGGDGRQELITLAAAAVGALAGALTMMTRVYSDIAGDRATRPSEDVDSDPPPTDTTTTTTTDEGEDE